MDNIKGTAADSQDDSPDDRDLIARLDLPTGAAAPGPGDHKAPGAFRTIGEVAAALGIRQHVLRYWEEQFPQLSPVKRSGNRRYYRPEDVAMIERIDRLVNHEGYTLRGARLALEPTARKPKRAADGAAAVDAPPAGAAAMARDASPDMLRQLEVIRATLMAALTA